MTEKKENVAKIERGNVEDEREARKGGEIGSRQYQRSIKNRTIRWGSQN